MRVRWLLTALPLLLVLSAEAQTFTNEFQRLRVPPDPTKPINSVAVADYNSDGRLDFYHSGRLYRQAPDGTFENVLEQAGVLLEGNAVQGGLFGDANRDGLLDLLILDGGSGSRFYLNRVGEKFDLGNSTNNLIFQDPPFGGFWVDLNADSHVDLVTGNRQGNHAVFLGSNAGTFNNVSDVWRSTTPSVACGLAMADYDHDNDADFFVARCGAGNVIMQNNAVTDRFTTISRGHPATQSTPSQEALWFDYNNDGWEDLLVANSPQEFNRSQVELYRNDAGSFVNVAEEAGIRGGPLDHNGPSAVADFDNDGWLDLYLGRGGFGRLLRNRQDGTFEDIWQSSVALDSIPDVVATADLDNDGWMDLILPHQNGTALMMNDGGTNHWATFQLRTPPALGSPATSPGYNRFALGARIHVTVNGSEQVRTITAGTGGTTQHDGLRAHFGVGSATSIDEVRIHWPSGGVETYTDVAVDRHHTLVQGLGFNDAPAAFDLQSPVHAGYVDPSETSIRFAWNPATDTDNVRYTLVITGKALRLTLPGLQDPFVDLDTSVLPANQVYTWSVLATDGFSLRSGQREFSFSFGQPDVANTTLLEPVLYDFGLPNLSSGVAEFADIDQDGDLDLLVGGDAAAGTSILRIYRAEDATVILGNNGGEVIFKSMNRAGITLETVSQPRAGWGDVNGDSFPDLVVSGIQRSTGEPLTTLYMNQVGQFIPLSVDGLTNVWGGAVEWADMDADGHEDLIVVGSRTRSAPYDVVSGVWMSDGTGALRAVDAGIPPFMFGDVAFSDIDGDGDLDMALTGDLGQGRPHVGIYENTGVGSGGQFVERPATLTRMMGGSVAWGDADGDGDADLLVSGGTLDPQLQRGLTELYLNEGGSFVRHPFPFDGVVAGRAIWGDYENDGDLDVFVVGARTPLGETVGRLFRNENAQFVAELDVKGFVHATAAFGDYNGDGDLDLIAFGIDAEGNVSTTFYINQQIAEPVPVTR
ncbi:MAG: VCBS repeat-containing protein [Bacteroidetes bacterium]|nr:VCBS repeat-containing protein [Bacteroidota bacterium]